MSQRDLEWADVVLVMKHRHRDILRGQFGDATRDVKIEVLDIADDFQFMDADLVTLLQQRVRGVLGDVID